MKRNSVSILAFLFFAVSAFGQGSMPSGTPVAVDLSGRPLPGVLVAICSANPLSTAPPCASLVPTFTDVTLGVACSGSAQPLNNQAQPSVGSGCSNPGLADNGGNVIAFASAGAYWCQYYGPTVKSYVLPCIFPAAGSGTLPNPANFLGPVTTPGPLTINGGDATLNLVPQPSCLFQGVPGLTDQISTWNDGARDWPMWNDGTLIDCKTFQIVKTQGAGYTDGQVNAWNAANGDFEPGPISAPGFNSTIYVDGNKYPLTPAGIQAAISAAGASGTVILPPTLPGNPILMGNTSLTMASNVRLVGAGRFQTTLRWTSNINAILVPAGTTNSHIEEMTLSFSSAASTTSAGIRVFATDAAVVQYNTFRDLWINFDSIGTGTSGIFVLSTGPSGTDFSLNTIDNVGVWQGQTFAVCTGCEGNFWNNVQGVNLGGAAGSMFIENGLNADEIVTARMESGSGNPANMICYSTTGNNNHVKLTCDTQFAGTAVLDTGGWNIFDVSTIGIPTLGTIPSTSQYRYVNSNAGGNVLSAAKLSLPGATSGASTVVAPATGGGAAILPAGGGTLCYTSVCTGSGTLYLDASLSAGADPCAKINAALTTAAGSIPVTAEAFTGTQACGSTPIPSTAKGKLIFGCGLKLQDSFGSIVIPTTLRIEGCDPSQAGTGNSGTIIQAITGFPTGARTPLLCYGAAGVCGGSGNFSSPISNLTLDCNNITNCIAFNNSVAQENSPAYNIAAINGPIANIQLSNIDGSIATHMQNYHMYDVLSQYTGDYCLTNTDAVYINGEYGITITNLTANLSATGGCTTNAPAEVVQVNGIGVTLINPHMEANSRVNTNGLSIGNTLSTGEVVVIEPSCAGMSGGDCVRISNAHSQRNISIFGLHAGSSGATNSLNDQIRGNAFSVGNTSAPCASGCPNVGAYFMGVTGETSVITTMAIPNNFPGGIVGGITKQTPTGVGTVTLNMNTGNTQQVVCGGAGGFAITLALSNLNVGQMLNLVFVQNGASACTVVFPGTMHSPTTVSATLSSVSSQSFMTSNNDTDLYAVGAGAACTASCGTP